MSVEFTIDRVTGVIHLCGEIDIACADDLEEGLEAAVNADRELSLDIRDVTFMDSTGLKFLIELARRRPARMITIVGARPAVGRLLSTCGIEQRMPNLRLIDQVPHRRIRPVGVSSFELAKPEQLLR